MSINVDPEAVEELHELLLELYPDPVDVFEDEVAAEAGVHRHPALSREEWRRIRVAAIDPREESRRH